MRRQSAIPKGEKKVISRRGLSAVLLASLATIFLAEDAVGEGTEVPQLHLEAKIPLADIRGRIDHMAVDLARHRLFVAALGSDSLAVVDLEAQRLDRIIGLPGEPQGVGYDPVTDRLYVANARDGSVSLLKGSGLSPNGRIELGSDADNIRVDSKAGRIFIGYGDGALAIVDAATNNKIADAPLKAHPESFQLDGNTGRILVNVPKAGTIDVVDHQSGEKIASWPTAGRHANFAMALDHARRHVLVAFRQPAELGVFSSENGSFIASVTTCGDVDDLFLDPKRDRVYVSCGEGFLDVLAADGDSYRQVARIATAPGARTSLFVPELDRLLLAVPVNGEAKAAIWSFRPLP
jgi:DNA-binding beta-propeller fold protein YncE